MRTVLLVDDEQRVIDALLTHIPWANFDTSVIGTANDAEEGIEKYKTLHPDIIMTDIYMPEVDGLEFVEIIREQSPDIPIIILSGYDKFENARKAIHLNINYFLLKPVTVDELQYALQDVCQELDTKDREKKLKQSYDAELTNMLPAMREHFFLELLNSRFRPEEISSGRLDFLKLSCPDHSLAISLQVLRPQDLSSSKERNWQLLRYGAANIIEEIIREQLKDSPGVSGFNVAYADNLFVIVLMSATGNRETTDAAAFSMSEKIIGSFGRFLNISATVGIGHAKPGLHLLCNSYLESRKALEISEYESLNRVYHINDAMRIKDDYSEQFPLDGMKQINKALSDNAYTIFLDSWHHMYNGIMKAEQRISLSTLRIICINILSSLTMTWAEISEHEASPFDMSASVKKIYQYPAIFDLMTWMNHVIEQWYQEISKETRCKKSNQLIAQVKAYVEGNYDKEIHFSNIAKSLYVSRNYLSQLFKKETGETFVSYLNKYRIARAKELMQQNHYKLYEISEMVGYQNSTYFCEIFKNITGQSPSKYVGS